MTDQSIGQQIQATAPRRASRVTPADIEAEIIGEHYFTAAQGAKSVPFARDDIVHGALTRLTFCVLVLRNGFTVTGESACANPENFNAELGRRIAREHAVDKVWMLLGYALKQRLHDAEGSAQ